MEKEQIIRNIFSFFFIIASISIIVIIVYFTIKEHKRISQIDIMIAEQKERYEEVMRKNRLTKELIAYKKTAISKERDIHERGYYEDGEKVIVIKNTKNTKNTKEEEEEEEVPISEKHIIKKPILAWYNVFFGNR